MGKDFIPYKRKPGRPPKIRVEHTAKNLGLPVWVVTLFIIVMIAVYAFVSYNMWLFPFTGEELFNGFTLYGNPNSEYAPPSDDGDDGDGDGGEGMGGGPGAISGDLSIHFLELGNKYTGDSTFIKAGDIDILVDAGSRVGSISTIKTYIDAYCTDGVLEYVFVTHAHEDHYGGFATGVSTDSIFDLYECETIITFAGTNQKQPTAFENLSVYSKFQMNNSETTTSTGTLFGKFLRELEDEINTTLTKGTKAGQNPKHYTVDECYNNLNGATREIALTDDIEIEILDTGHYKNSPDENDYSISFMLKHGERNFLFTGDLEAAGEAYLAEHYNLPQVELFKGGHHGSPTSSSAVLLQEIRPKKVCVCCCAGGVEYTQNISNTFPSQEFIDRISQYTDSVYVTTMAIVEYEIDPNHGTSKDDSFYTYDATLDKYIYTDKETGNYMAEDVGYQSMNGNIRVVSSVDSITVDCTNNNTKLKDTTWFSENRIMPTYWQAATN